MRAKQFIQEADLGTNPKRPARAGSRPSRGHEPQKRYVTDRKTGKQYDPEEEFDKLKNSDDFKAQMKRMAQKEGFDYTMKDLGNDYAGFPSNHSLKHKMLKRISPEHHQLYKDKINNTHDSDQLVKLFHVAKARGHVIDEGVAEGSTGVSVRKWANQVRKDHGADVKFWNRKEGGGAVDSVVAKNSSGETVGVYNRKTGYPTVFEPKQGVAEGSDERSQNALWAQMTAHEKAAKKSKDLKQQHHLKMADQLRSQLKTSDNMSEHMAAMESELEEHGKASRELCKSSKPDADLGASMLASCKSQGLRARDGNKSHKLGKTAKSRVKVGGHRIKGNKYGGPLPDWS